MNTDNRPFRVYRFVFESLDPVHVGVGGHRLGRVDLPIAREPGTNLPKIPGSGISGAARHYASIQAGRPQCAGQGGAGADARGHCGQPAECPVCYTFGSLRGQTDGGSVAAAGRVRVFDARLLLFPVATFRGPVWVTSPQVLKGFGLDGIPEPAPGKARVTNTLAAKPINLGWLMVEIEGEEFSLSTTIGGSTHGGKAISELYGQLPQYVRDRLVLVNDDLYSIVVNSNLEVRTSVSIDPETGAAKDGALFTYEALPRASFLYLDVVEELRVAPNGRSGMPFPWPQQKEGKTAGNGVVAPESWKSALDVITAGFRYFEFLGVGGMSTRGFGRIKQIACREVPPQC